MQVRDLVLVTHCKIDSARASPAVGILPNTSQGDFPLLFAVKNIR